MVIKILLIPVLVSDSLLVKTSGTVNFLLQQNDVIAADLSLTSAREEFIDFTNPYLCGKVYILINPAYGQNNVTYLVQKGTSYQEFLQVNFVAHVFSIWTTYN